MSRAIFQNLLRVGNHLRKKNSNVFGQESEVPQPALKRQLTLENSGLNLSRAFDSSEDWGEFLRRLDLFLYPLLAIGLIILANFIRNQPVVIWYANVSVTAKMPG